MSDINKDEEVTEAVIVEVEETLAEPVSDDIEAKVKTEEPVSKEKGMSLWENNIQAKLNLDKFVSDANIDYYWHKVFGFSSFSEKEYNTKFKKILTVENEKIKMIENRAHFKITKAIKALEDKCNNDIAALKKKSNKAKNALESKLAKLDTSTTNHEKNVNTLSINLNVLMANDNVEDNTAKYVMDFLQPASAKTIGINIPSTLDNELSSLYSDAVGKAFTRFTDIEKEEYMLKMYRKYNSEIHSTLREYDETKDVTKLSSTLDSTSGFISHLLKNIILSTISLNVEKILKEVEEVNTIAVEPVVIDTETIKGFKEELSNNNSQAINIMNKISLAINNETSETFKTGDELADMILNDFKVKYFNAEIIVKPKNEAVTEEPTEEQLIKHEKIKYKKPSISTQTIFINSYNKNYNKYFNITKSLILEKLLSKNYFEVKDSKSNYKVYINIDSLDTIRRYHKSRYIETKNGGYYTEAYWTYNTSAILSAKMIYSNDRYSYFTASESVHMSEYSKIKVPGSTYIKAIDRSLSQLVKKIAQSITPVALSPLQKRQAKVLEKAKTKAFNKSQKTFKLDKDTVAALDKMIDVANENGEATTSMTSLVQFILDDFLGIYKSS